MGGMVFASLQLVSAIITALIVMQFKTTTSWLSFILAFSLAHYMLAIFYSRKNIAQKRLQKLTWIPLLVLAAIGAYLYNSAFPLMIYFSVHHVINDVYTRIQSSKINHKVSGSRLIIVCALLCNSLGLMSILHGGERVLSLPNREWVAGFFGLSLVVYTLILLGQKVEDKKQFVLSNLSTELLYACFIPISYVFRIELYHVICYHAVFWTFFPLFKFSAVQSIQYLALTVFMIGFFLLISPIGIRSTQVPFHIFMGQFTLWSYVHITLAFATSTAHPDWIVRLFGNRIKA